MMSATLDAGDYAAIISAAILVGGLVFGWLRYQWVKTNPFRMMVSLDPYELTTKRERQWAKRVDLSLGDNLILIAVSPRKGTSWDKVNIRFVNRRFSPRFNQLWKYEDSGKEVIEVTDFEDVFHKEFGTKDNRPYFEADPDEVGGFNGFYIPPIPVVAGRLVWFYVHVKAKGKWEGFASFEGILEERRAWTRIKAGVKSS